MKTIIILGGALLLCLSGPGMAMAQTPKYEVGGLIFSLQGKQVGSGYGFGGRFTYNLNRHVAIDSEVNAFVLDEGAIYATQGFVGPKVGVRSKYVGVFAKARPGFSTNFSKAAPNFATTFASRDPDSYQILRLVGERRPFGVTYEAFWD